MSSTLTSSTSSINLEAAAHEAALADGIISSSLSDNSKINDSISKTKKAGLRRGKWTAEEESYANRLISEFKMGLLPLTDGTTLRTFLSKLLNCDPMRISKKFVGGNCIGKVRTMIGGNFYFICIFYFMQLTVFLFILNYSYFKYNC